MQYVVPHLLSEILTPVQPAGPAAVPAAAGSGVGGLTTGGARRFHAAAGPRRRPGAVDTIMRVQLCRGLTTDLITMQSSCHVVPVNVLRASWECQRCTVSRHRPPCCERALCQLLFLLSVKLRRTSEHATAGSGQAGQGCGGCAIGGVPGGCGAGLPARPVRFWVPSLEASHDVTMWRICHLPHLVEDGLPAGPVRFSCVIPMGVRVATQHSVVCLPQITGLDCLLPEVRLPAPTALWTWAVGPLLHLYHARDWGWTAHKRGDAPSLESIKRVAVLFV